MRRAWRNTGTCWGRSTGWVGDWLAGWLAGWRVDWPRQVGRRAAEAGSGWARHGWAVALSQTKHALV